MSEQLRYGFEPCRNNRELGPLYVDVPSSLVRWAVRGGMGDDPFPQFSPYEWHDIEDGSARFRILARRIGRQPAEMRAQSLARIMSIVSAITTAAAPAEQDPRLTIVSSVATLGISDRLGVGMDILVPQVSDEVTTAVGTMAMHQIAKAIGFNRRPGMDKRRYERQINQDLYARVERGRRLLLQTNEMGSCSVEAGADDYDPATNRFAAGMHNLYSHEQQLVCIAGGIGVAYADQLAHKLA